MESYYSDPSLGTDGLALSDSSGNPTDLSAFGGSQPIQSNGAGSGAPDVNAYGNGWGGPGLSGAPTSSYWTGPSTNLGFGASPANGYSGATLPTGTNSSGGLSGWLNQAFGIFRGVSQVQQQAQGAQIAGQPLLSRIGLADPTGKLTTTGMLVIGGGVVLAALMLMKH